MVYPSYTLGDNSTKGRRHDGPRADGPVYPDAPKRGLARSGESVDKKLADLADVVEQSREGIAYTHWGLERHQWGAFKMDGPDQLDNTRTLYAALLRMSDGAIAIGEELTFEGGFASGALASATHGVQQFVRRQGGDTAAEFAVLPGVAVKPAWQTATGKQQNKCFPYNRPRCLTWEI